MSLWRLLRPAVLGALLILFTRAIPAAGAPAEAPLSFSHAVDLALAASRSLAAARLGSEATRAGIDVARQRPNPELVLEEARETPKDSAGLSQTLETAGKRRRRIELAEAGVARSEAELERLAVTVRGEVRRAFYGLLAAQRRLDETEELLRLAERTRDVARARFDSGDVPRLDVVQAELAAADAGNEVEAAQGLLTAARAQLNTLLARALDAPTEVDGSLEEGAVPEAAEAARLAVAHSTELAVLDRGLAEQRARLALTEAEQVPDPVLEGTVTHRAEPEFDWGWRAGLTLPLPVFTRNRAAVQVEDRTLAQLTAERDARAAAMAGEVYAAAARAAAQRQQVLGFRDRILPQTAEVESMAEDSYRSGQTGLPTLLQALRDTRDLRLRAIQAGADYQDALADLEDAMGAPLP